MSSLRFLTNLIILALLSTDVLAFVLSPVSSDVDSRQLHPTLRFGVKGNKCKSELKDFRQVWLFRPYFKETVDGPGCKYEAEFMRPVMMRGDICSQDVLQRLEVNSDFQLCRMEVRSDYVEEKIEYDFVSGNVAPFLTVNNLVVVQEADDQSNSQSRDL